MSGKLSPCIFLSFMAATMSANLYNLVHEYMRCNASYANRDFLPWNATRQPAMLLSHKGSGQTWTRLLLEYSTGIVTGSIYNDIYLKSLFPGEISCVNRQAVVRAHPDDVHLTSSRNGLHVKIEFIGYDAKCLRGKANRFEKFLVIIRDPYRALWSEYQRRVTLGAHNEGIEQSKFNQSAWEEDLLEKSALEYAVQWPRIYKEIFRDTTRSFIIVQYEHLANPNTRIATLKKLVDFLQLGVISEDRLKCAFFLAENPIVKRSVDAKAMVTIDQAYQSKEVVCTVWKIMLNMTDLISYGYTPWKNTTCTYSSRDISDIRRKYALKYDAPPPDTGLFPLDDSGSTCSGKSDAVVELTIKQPDYNTECRRCNASYFRRGYLPGNATRQPAMLLSNRGSGHVWTRLLLEYSTGLVSGTIYNDGHLRSVFPTKKKPCANRQAIVGAHPYELSIKPRRSGRRFHVIINKFRGYNRDCIRGKVYVFEQFAILLRDPYRAIWSEYQRRFTRGARNTGISVKEFNQTDWEKELMANLAVEYAAQWPRMYDQILEIWPNNTVVVQYEHLADPSMRIATLNRLVDFLNVGYISEDRLKCAFFLAENPIVRRSVDAKAMVTIDQAYQSKEVVCTVWKIMLNMTDLVSYGYTPWKNTMCTYSSLDISDILREYKGPLT
jgi:hypothetical protein